MSDRDELRHYVDRLMSDRFADGAFLIITVSGTQDFLQMTADAQGVQLDFPLITARQISLESRIRQAAEREGLEVLENRGSDGGRFLDMEVEGDGAEVARVCRAMLRDVFGAGEGTRLEFEGEGLG